MMGMRRLPYPLQLALIQGDPATLAAPDHQYRLWRGWVSDDYYRTSTAWAPGGTFAAAAIVSTEEAAGAGTLIDFGGVTSGVVLWARLRANTATNALELVYRTNGGTATQTITLPSGTWGDKQPRFVWMQITTGTPGTWRFGVGDPAVGVGVNNKTGTVAGGIPTAASAQPVRLWTDVNGKAIQSAGYMALAVWDALPTDGALGAAPTDSAGFAALMAAATTEGRTLLLGARASAAGEVAALEDPSGLYTWTLVRGTRPVYTARVAEPQYTLGAVRAGIVGQSNARAAHTDTAETITLPPYTLVQSTGTTVNSGSNITAYGPDLGLIATMGPWATSIEVGKHAVGGSAIATWIGAGANRTAWYAVLDAMSAPPTDIIWIHGEADAIDLANANAYGTNLQTWIDETLVKVPGARLWIALLQELPAGYPYWATVRAHQDDRIAANAPVTGALSTEALTKIADNVHYDGGSIRALGGRAAHQIAEAM